MTLSSVAMHHRILFWISFIMVSFFLLFPQWRLAILLRSSSFCFEHALRKAPTVAGHWNWKLNVSGRKKLWDERLEEGLRWLLPVITADIQAKDLWSWEDFFDSVVRCSMGVFAMPTVRHELGSNLWWGVVNFLLGVYGIGWWFSDWAN
ncbi:hypothetical protein DL95DRAFT_398307 [Leptodontidium sp. 2 PMI_412]|nr:hypothetical protein DL95DRAFT_398307 [Leptodontidium sp. 2 PMI_412]